MIKHIEYDKQARVKLKEGFDALAKAVSVTLGPKGRNVVIEKDGAFPVITKDGVSVAKEIELEDPIQNLGAQMLKQVSLNTNLQAGDGTTTATVLAKAILDAGFAKIEKGTAPIDVKREIDNASKNILNLLDSYSNKVKGDYRKIYNIANISSNSDKVLAKLITDLFEKTNDSTILLEQSETKDTHTEFIEGLSFGSSYVDASFVNSDNRECNLKNPYYLIYNGKIKSAKEIVHILEMVSRADKPLVIIADQVSQDVVLTLLRNRQNGTLESAVINSPGFGPGRKEQLEDIAVVTGGEVIRDGMLGKFMGSQLGSSKTVSIKEDETIISKGSGSKRNIKKRITELEVYKNRVQGSSKNKIEERISKLKGGIGIIYIGANSELEYKEKYDRIEDAIHAVKAAIKEGYISGGGTTLYMISGQVEDSILSEAIKAPYYQIQFNSGKSKITPGEDYKDFLKQGIIDPKKVTRVALENAISVAGTILTTDCAIVNKRHEA